MGNILEQGMNSSNSNMVAYGLEGLSNPGPHNIFICYNTFVNKKDKGSFIQVPSSGCDTLWVKNNILSGAKTGGLILGNPTILDSSNNYITDLLSTVKYANSAGFDYHLLPGSPAIDKGVVLQKIVKGHRLQPDKSYTDTCKFSDRSMQGLPDIGCFELINPNSTTKTYRSLEPMRLSVVKNQVIIHNIINKNTKNALVYAATGACIMDIKPSATSPESPLVLNLQHCHPGIYTLVLNTEKGSFVVKVLLE
jgi:hypothetical protein